MYEYTATCRRVIDGDTVVLDIDLGCHIYVTKYCRLFGINAPERSTGEPGKAATAYLSGLILNTKLRCKTYLDKGDKYGRLLVELWVGEDTKDFSVNQLMLKDGMAVAMVM